MTSNLPAPLFIADHIAIDFLNSVGAPWGDDIDWLQNGIELLSWMQAAGVLPKEAAKRVGASESRQSLDRAAARARALREALRAGMPNPDDDFIEVLNTTLATGAAFWQIKAGDPPLLCSEERFETADDLLVPIAAGIADLLCNTVVGRRRHCGGPTCTFWFCDTTKNNRRRWCSMSVCGNRAKVAAHRARNS